MRGILVASVLLSVSVCLAEIIEIENPPPVEENGGEFSWIPDEDGQLYRVNTEDAMNEPISPFGPKITVKFELYTIHNVEQPQVFGDLNEEFLINSKFDKNRPTRFVTHGWKAGGLLTKWFREAYFTKGHYDVNLFIVDWGAAANANYIVARRRVEPIGKYVADFIELLVKVSGLNLKTTTLIGHSLGAHVSGFAGKNLRSGKCSKIIALDAAAPLFNYYDPKNRVAVGDADYVESIHTNGGFLGFSQPIGDAAFYPNGGMRQPGCGIDLTGSCSHSRSYRFLAESIASEKDFRSYKCGSFNELVKGRCNVKSKLTLMGGEPGNLGAARGIFFVRTNSQSPFILPAIKPFNE